MQLKITIEIWRKKEWYIARCPELDFVSQGKTAGEARYNLYEVMEIQFEEMAVLGTIEDYMTECGYELENQSYISRTEMVGFENSFFEIAACQR